MDHETSIKTLAAEKYLLGELSSPEREGFEQHFFECPECAESVRTGFEFSESANSLFCQESLPGTGPARRSWFRNWFAALRPAVWVPVAACLIAAFSGYQNTVAIPALRERLEQLEKPQLVPTSLLAPASRSAVPSVGIPPRVQFVQLSLATAAVPPAERYQCELRTAAGKSLVTLPVSRLEPDANLNLLIPVARLADGVYEAVLSGVSGGTLVQLEHYRFAVSRK